MSCLDSIVTLGSCPDDGISSSGFTLITANGISIKNLNAIANENEGTGIAFAMQKKTMAITQVKNDLIAALNVNNVATKISQTAYNASEFNPSINNGNYAGERGLTIYRPSTMRGKLRKQKITTIQLYPLTSGDFTLNIYDNGMVSHYPVTLVSGQINEFTLNYTIKGTFARILIDNTALQLSSSKLICMLGCNGHAPNDCGYVKGWDGTKEVKWEGYGINIVFYCYCDWDQILCDLSQTYIGELIWLKWQINIFDEQYKTNRFNNWVIYNRDELPAIINSLDAEYSQKWNALMAGLFTILNNYKDDCLQCRGIRWVVNT